MKFTKTIKSSICVIAVTAALTVPTASSALAAPVRESASVSVSAVARPAFPMYGGIGAKWNAIGSSTSSLGNPVGYQFGGLRNGGAAQYFQHGAIVWSPTTGSKISVGAIRSTWLSTGATNGRLAYPTTDEYAIPGGVRQDYQGGFITWDSRTGRTAINALPAPAPAPPKVPAATQAAPPAVASTQAAPVVDNSPAGAKAFAKSYLQSIGWGDGQYQCLVQLWEHESNWNFTATNRSSGSYGIAQALPADKMASAGADWKTNSQTQIRWGVSYIKDRYQTPCGAMSAWNVKGWY